MSIILNNKRKIILLLIVAAGFLVRTVIWLFGHGGSEGIHSPMVVDSSPFTRIASSFDPSSGISFFSHPHAIYVVYPLYLSPAFAFGLNLENYIFWLHHFFAASTILLIYAGASRIGGSGAGLLAGLVYAFQLQVAFLFDRAYATTALHFQLALFMYCSLMCWERATPKRLFLFVITGLMVPLTRPEGAVFPAVALLVLVYRLAVPRLGIKRTLAVCLGTVVVVLLSGIYVLKQNKEVREAVFSHYHVGRLYYGIQDTPTELGAYIENLTKTDQACRVKEAQDPEHRSEWYWCTVMGLEQISNDPLSYLIVLSKRFFSQLYPSFFREGISWKNKLYDRSNMSFIIMGVALIFILDIKEKRFEMAGLILMALACYMGLSYSIYIWDVINELTPQVLLLPVASVGWVRLANLAYKRFTDPKRLL